MDQVFIEEVVKQIGNLGFPALIAMYLLTRFEKKFDQLIELMTELKDHAKNNFSIEVDFSLVFSLNKTEGKTKGLSPSLSAITFKCKEEIFHEKTK